MCGIWGAVGFSDEETGWRLRQIGDLTETRGRDSWGISIVTRDGIADDRGRGRFSASDHSFNLGSTRWYTALGNLRAEPTTEYVAKKRLCDIQPFECGPWIVAHNGTIANDKELRAKHDLSEPVTPIDSFVIAQLLNRYATGFAPRRVETLLNKLVGSYALALAHRDHPGSLILASNYKPIYVRKLGNQWYFSSVAEALPGGEVPLALGPYQFSTLTPGGPLCSDTISLSRKPLRRSTTRKRAVVVCSGGLDSVTAATQYVRDGYDVLLMHAVYGCRAQTREMEAVNNVARELMCGRIFVTMPSFGSSALLDPNAKISDGESGSEFAHEWVPARNLLLIATATALAEAKGYNIVATGTNLEESGAYPDNEPEFNLLLDKALQYATAPDKPVNIEMPVGYLMKHEIVKRALELRAPVQHAWSCYQGGDVHCGQCGPCYMRQKAFLMNRTPDPVQYAKPMFTEEQYRSGL